MDPVKKTKKIPPLPVVAGFMILISLLVAAWCSGKAPEPSELQLEGTRWTLTDYVYNDTSLQVLNGTSVTLDFREDGRITGSAGCNHYFASYDMKGTTVTIGPAGSTLMYCHAAGVMEQESTYLTLLGEASSVMVVNDRLALADAGGGRASPLRGLFRPHRNPL